MGEPLRVFISHNATKSQKTTEFLTELQAVLENQRGEDGERLFMPFVDRALETGDPWRGVLYNWMLVCDLAVILLDENSKNSRWVPREATIFTWRRQLDPTFRVLPVLLDGISQEMLFQAPYQDLGLNELGFVRCSEAGQLVEALRAEQKPKGNCCLSRLEGMIGRIEPSILQTFLEDSRDLLDLEPNPFAAGIRTKRAIAASLLGYGFRKGPLKAAGEMFPSAKALRILAQNGGKRDEVREISQAIRFYWVDPLASVKLLSAGKVRGSNVKVIAIRMNIERKIWPQQLVNDYFAQAYSQDRHRSYDLLRVEPLSMQMGRSSERAELMERIRAALWKFANRLEEDRSASENTFLEEAFRGREGEIFCWFVQSDPVKIDQLVEMQREFPHLRMVYLCFDDSCRSREDVEFLEPSLVEKAEKEAMSEIETSMLYFSTMGGSG